MVDDVHHSIVAKVQSQTIEPHIVMPFLTRCWPPLGTHPGRVDTYGLKDD